MSVIQPRISPVAEFKPLPLLFSLLSFIAGTWFTLHNWFQWSNKGYLICFLDQRKSCPNEKLRFAWKNCFCSLTAFTRLCQSWPAFWKLNAQLILTHRNLSQSNYFYSFYFNKCNSVVSVWDWLWSKHLLFGQKIPFCFSLQTSNFK